MYKIAVFFPVRVEILSVVIVIAECIKTVIMFFLGIVQLEIRRARLNDAGTYTVTATNELGEASCSAEVSIKEIKGMEGTSTECDCV